MMVHTYVHTYIHIYIHTHTAAPSQDYSNGTVIDRYKDTAIDRHKRHGDKNKRM